MRTLQEMAQEALDVQDACNLVAVANGFARAMSEMMTDHKMDTDEIRHHPITTMWVSKIETLNGQTGMACLGTSIRECREIAGDPLTLAV